MTDLTYRSATELVGDLNAKRVSARELLDAALARNEALHGALNMVVAKDVARAQRDAAAIDEARAKGQTLGALAGLPMTVKDGFDVEGMPAVCGNPDYADRDKNCRDAEVVARARRAGAIPWGKTNVPIHLGDWQSYNSVYGATKNPYDVTRTPGGSSGGAAAALATGVTSIEIGSDIGGSLRIPANFCGIYALKPTWGQLPGRGHVPPPPGIEAEGDLGVMGPMARTPADLRLLYGVLRDAPARAAQGIKGRRVALWLDEPEFQLSADSRAAVERAAEVLKQQGADVRAAKPPVPMGPMLDAYLGILMPIIGAGLPEEAAAVLDAQRASDLAAVKAGASRYSEERSRLGTNARFREVLVSMGMRDAFKKMMAGFFAEGWDAVLAPISVTTAFPHDHSAFYGRSLQIDNRTIPYAHMLDWIALATSLHMPALAAPAGRTSEGMPVGVQVIGRWNEEEAVLDYAEALDEAFGFKPPAL